VSGGDPRVHLELEAKLEAPEHFELPDLSHLGPAGTAVTALPPRELDATYYDTTDLGLARSGITLRYRQGEAGPPWTVKLPETTHGPGLARREVSFEGTADTLPEPAVDLVTATSRGRPLAPVARLHTRRRPYQVVDVDRRRLGEIVDDAVEVWRGERRTGRFREIEIEIDQPGRPGRRLLDTSMARLAEAGCQMGVSVPKLVRALGERASQPPDVVVASLHDHATIADLVGHAVARSVAQLIRHDPGVRLGDDPEDVHQLRVATRRLRSDLRTFAALFHPDPVTAIRAELGWLGAQVGAVRDSDVLAMRLTDSVQTLPAEDSPGAALLLEHLHRQRSEARTAMLAALRDGRYLRIIDSLIEFAGAPPLIETTTLAAKPSARVATDLARRPWTRLAKAVARIGPEPTDTELHQIRILAKRCRYAAEAVSPVIPGAGPFAARVADLQTVLGDHQDTVVAETWLRDAALALPLAGVAAGQLIGIERAGRAELKLGWPGIWRKASAKKLRRWM
jgi:CHAD domain-containing protein